MARQATFATIEQLPSKRWQVRYTGPDGVADQAPHTFDDRMTPRRTWSRVRRKIDRDRWNATDDNPTEQITFGAYAARWLANRQVAGRPIKARTREHYSAILDDHLLPTFGNRQLAAITAEGRARLVRGDAGRPARRCAATPTPAAHHHGVRGQR